MQRMYEDLQLADTGSSMVEGMDGSLWIALKDKGVVQVDSCGKATLQLPDIKVLKVMQGNDRNIWLHTRRTWCCLF